MMTTYPGRILSIDYGNKRIGVAMSDPTRLIAQGVATLANDEKFMEKLLAIVKNEEVVRIIVGMPYNQSVGKGKKELEVEEFIRQLKLHTAVEIDILEYSSTIFAVEFIAVILHQIFQSNIN